jgi:hypothetical protein
MRPRDSTVGYSTRKGRGSPRDRTVQPVSRLAPSRHPVLAHGLLEIENRGPLVNRGTPRAAEGLTCNDGVVTLLGASSNGGCRT